MRKPRNGLGFSVWVFVQMNPSKTNFPLVLALLIACHLLVNYVIITQSSLLRIKADARYVTEAVRFSRIIADKKGGLLKAAGTAIKTNFHPHLYGFMLGVVTALTKAATPKDLDVPIQLVNSVFFVILILSVYGIGSILYGRRQALMAAILLSFSPVIFGLVRLAQLEVPLAAFVSLCVYLLLKSNFFESRMMSLAAGIVFGLAQLTKETALLFILPPFIFCGLRILFSTEGRQARMRNCALALITAVIVSAPVYLNSGNKNMFYVMWSHASLMISPGGEDPFFYFSAFPRLYLGWLTALLVFPLLVSCFFNMRKRNILLALWLICPLIVFSMSRFKCVLYLIPSMPALFVIISGEAFTPFFLRAGQLYPILVALASGLQYGLINFFPAAHDLGSTPYAVHETGLLFEHHDKHLPIAEKLASYIAQKVRRGTRMHILHLPYMPICDSLEYFCGLRGVIVGFVSLDKVMPDNTPMPVAECFKDVDCLILFSCGSREKPFWVGIPKECKGCVAACLPLFERAQEFPVEYGCRVEVYMKKTQTVSGFSRSNVVENPETVWVFVGALPLRNTQKAICQINYSLQDYYNNNHKSTRE